MERSDNEIITEVLNGNVEAYTEIIRRHKQRIYRVVYRFAPDLHEANDLLQEVFIKIYRVLNQYDGKASFASWALRVASNLCIDHLRRRKEMLPTPNEALYDIPDHQRNPEETYLHNEETKAIYRAIGELPEKYRLPLILFHQEEMTYEEIAVILKLPMSRVKNRLYRARLVLRKKLMKREGGALCNALHAVEK